ncbi:hypothetical protein GUJ93_ZPchr0001g29246 [Zizania palustris]|uniref:F-box domain-containing protein n=1 Tax=Zizania palustris TaxID=103762 RepID=A0A8J5RMQ7_ZIZPA|nr:hypothetical protein GUJ93_ZPchr0001g29246 [Zizania palustris]
MESSSEKWPSRRDVVACAGVCRQWRDVVVAIVRPPLESRRITFPSSLKQVGSDQNTNLYFSAVLVNWVMGGCNG